MKTRKYIQTLSELIDRLSIVQLKEVFITDHKQEYSQEINDIIAGKQVANPVVSNATRRQAYAPGPVAPSYGQYKMEPKFGNTASTVTTPVSPINAEINRVLGSDWFTKQQAAAAAGDWETYYAIQRQVDAIINPVIDRP